MGVTAESDVFSFCRETWMNIDPDSFAYWVVWLGDGYRASCMERDNLMPHPWSTLTGSERICIVIAR